MGSFPRLQFQDYISQYLGSKIRLHTQDWSVGVIFDAQQMFFSKFPIISALSLSPANIETDFKNQTPGRIEICATTYDRNVNDDCRKQIFGVYNLIETRNGELCYQHSQNNESNKQPRLRFERLAKYRSKGCWVIGPILHTIPKKPFYNTTGVPYYDQPQIMTEKQITVRLFDSKINAHEYEFETPWNQHYDTESYPDKIRIGSIRIKALFEKQEDKLSDNDDDVPVSRNSTYSFDSDMNALRQAVLKYPVKQYFSTDQSLLDLEINADYQDSFSNMVTNSLSNERSFGHRELYLNDLTRLNGTNWANDKVIDAMFDIIQRKCCSLGIPVVAIPVAWYYFFTVSFS